MIDSPVVAWTLQPGSGFTSLVITAALEPLAKLDTKLNTRILITPVNAET